METKLLQIKLTRHNSLGELGVARSLSAQVLGSSTDQDYSPPLRFSTNTEPHPNLALRCKYFSRRVSSARASQKRCYSEQLQTRKVAPPDTPRRQSMFDFHMRSSLAVIYTRVASIGNTLNFKVKNELKILTSKNPLISIIVLC